MEGIKALLPRTLLGVILWGILLVMLAKTLAPGLATIGGWLIFAVAAGGFFGCFLLREKALRSNISVVFPALAGGLVGYLAVTAIGHIQETPTFGSLLNHMLPMNGVAPSGAHVVGIIVAIVAFLFVRRESDRSFIPHEEVVRGSSLLSQNEASSMARKLSTGSEKNIFWAGVDLPLRYAHQNFAIIGSPGSGKTLSLRLLMQDVLPGITAGQGSRALIYDAKRDFADLAAGMGIAKTEYQNLNPFVSDGVAWDIAKDVTDPAMAREVASILIPVDPKEMQKYFPEAAQALLAGVIMALVASAGSQWTLRDLLLAVRTRHRIKTILEAHGPNKHLVERFLGKGDGAIESTMERSLNPLSFVAMAWEQAAAKISITDWASGSGILVLGSSPKYETIMRSLNRVLFKRVTNLILDPSDSFVSEGSATWIFLDELKRAGRLDGLPDLLVEGRSKGLCAVIGTQDIPGLREHYEQHEAEEIIGTCGNKVFLQSSDPTTAKFGETYFQNQDVSRQEVSHSSQQTHNKDGTSSSHGTSSRNDRKTQPVVTAAEISNLPRPDEVRGIGIHGYAHCLALGSPHKMEVNSATLTQRLKPPKQVSNNERKIGSSLTDWTEKDLKRLGFTAVSESLLREPSQKKSGDQFTQPQVVERIILQEPADEKGSNPEPNKVKKETNKEKASSSKSDERTKPVSDTKPNPDDLWKL